MLSITKAKLFLAMRKAAVLLVIYFVQNLFARLPVLGAVPLLLPAAGIAVALCADGEWSAGWGLFAGLLCDISVGDSPLLFTITLTAAGFAAGFLSEFFLARSLVTYLLIATVTNAAIVIFQLIPRVFFKGIGIDPLFPVALAQFIYSALFIIPVYLLVRRWAIPKAVNS